MTQREKDLRLLWEHERRVVLVALAGKTCVCFERSDLFPVPSVLLLDNQAVAHV